MICARVESLTPVAALVGSRVYLETLPQSPTFPAIRVTLIDDGEPQQLRGPEGLARARVQIDHYVEATSGVDAYSAGVALEAAVHGDGLGPAASGIAGWSGRIGSPSPGIQNCAPQTRIAHYDAGARRVLTMTRDYLVSYTPMK